jgi:mannosyltransferase
MVEMCKLPNSHIIGEPVSGLGRGGSYDILTTSPPTLKVSKNPRTPATHSRLTLASWICVAITIVAAMLRFFNLGKESIWLDEGFSIWLAHFDWRSLWRIVSNSEANMAFYYLLLHLWVGFGESEVLVRSLSAVAGVLTIPVYFELCRRMFNTHVALIASLLLATNTFHTFYSQEARAYSLVVLLTTLSCLFFIRALDCRTRWDWVWYVLTATLASYSHFFAWLVIGAQWISLLALGRHSVPWRRFGASAVAIGILCAPLFEYILKDKDGHLDWISRPVFFDLYIMLGDFAGFRFRMLVFVFSVACLVALFFAIIEWKSLKSDERWHFVLLVCWFVIPVILTFGVSQWKPLFADRFLIVCLPAFLMLVSVGLSRISPPSLQAVVFVVIAIWTARCIWQYETELVKEDWRGASAYILTEEAHSDGLFFYVPWGQREFDYYARLEGRSAEVGTIVHADPEASGRTQELSTSLRPHLAEQFPRIWLIETHLYSQTLEQSGRAIQAVLTSQYSEVSKHSFRGVDVFLYSDRKPTPIRP